MARVIAAKSEQSQCMEKNTQAKIGELKAIPVEARGRHSKRHIVRYNYYKKDAPKGNLRDAACMFPVFSNFFPPYGPCESLQSACQHSWYISSFLYAACSPESIFIP